MMTFDDKRYKPDIFVADLRDAGVDPTTLLIETNNDGHLFVTVRVEDPDGAIATAVRSVTGDAHDATQITEGEKLEQVKSQIKDLRSVARNYADDVVALYGAIIAADAAADTTQERHDRIRQVMTDADAAFRSRFTQAMETETGIDIGSIGLPNLTIDQTRAVNAFARQFANSLVILLAM